MRNFLAFIRQFRVIIFFALLQGIALAWYFSSLQYPRSQYLVTANAVSGTFFEWRQKVYQYTALEQNNNWLQKQVSDLQENQPKNLYKMDHGLVKIDDTLHKVQYEYIPAEIIRSTHTFRNNYFTINIGSDQGVEKNMGVFGATGVVGTIHSTSASFAVVKSCLTEDINIAAMIENSGEHGFLKWDGRDARRGSLYGISNDRKVKKWSKIVTRGSAGIFPRGLAIGKVEKTAPIEGKPLWDVTVLYAEDFRRIQRVFVIKNLMKDEQLQLEEPYANQQ